MTNNPNELTIENSALGTVSSVARTTTITLGGDLQVGRIGYGTMRLTGPNRWGEYPDRDGGIDRWLSQRPGPPESSEPA